MHVQYFVERKASRTAGLPFDLLESSCNTLPFSTSRNLLPDYRLITKQHTNTEEVESLKILSTRTTWAESGFLLMCARARGTFEHFLPYPTRKTKAKEEA